MVPPFATLNEISPSPDLYSPALSFQSLKADRSLRQEGNGEGTLIKPAIRDAHAYLKETPYHGFKIIVNVLERSLERCEGSRKRV